MPNVVIRTKLRNILICDFELSMRATRILSYLIIDHTIEDILKMVESGQLKKIKGIGDKTFIEITECFSKQITASWLREKWGELETELSLLRAQIKYMNEILKRLREEAMSVRGLWTDKINLVEGYLLWQKQGLNPPPMEYISQWHHPRMEKSHPRSCSTVKQALAEYRRKRTIRRAWSSEDILSDFLDECCEIGPELNEGASVLYDCFENWWTKKVSKNPPKQRRFGQWLGMRFEKRKIKGAYVYKGISLQIE